MAFTRATKKKSRARIALIGPSGSGKTIDALTIAQRFERIADMTTNIAEDVIFLVEGRIVRHEAPETGG